MHIIDLRARIKHILEELTDSDKILIRSLEDILGALLRKKLIEQTDIPTIVWTKCVDRQKLRKELVILKKELELQTNKT